MGDPDHPANRGRLCSKGTALGETIALPGRLLHPEVRGKRASWDAALDAVAEGFRRALAERGPEGVALYVSGQLLTEDYYAANKFAKGFLGTANIDSNSRLCMSSAVAAHQRAFGEDVVPGIYEDLESADLLVLVGSNLAWCHPVLFQRVAAAKAMRPSMRVVVVDPRRTATCEGADLHLPLRPGSDVALFGALLAHLDAEGCADRAWIAEHTQGLGAALDAARAVAPHAAELTGLDPADLATFIRWFAETPRVVTLWSQGVNQSEAGTDKANAIINCHLLTGRIGKPGAGPFSVTGQPNAMGGREVGALATMLAGHLDWERPGEAELRARPLAGAEHRRRAGLEGGGSVPRAFRRPHRRALGHGDQPRGVHARWRRGARCAAPRALPRRVGLHGGDRHGGVRACPPARRRLGREGRHGDQQRARHLAASAPSCRRPARRGRIGGSSRRSRRGSAGATPSPGPARPPSSASTRR